MHHFSQDMQINSTPVAAVAHFDSRFDMGPQASAAPTAAQMIARAAFTGSPAATPATPYQTTFKRALDLCLIVLALPVLVPLLALLTLLVAMQGGKPFYRQIRVGRHGRRYTMWKFRTMVPDADTALAAHLAACPAARAEWTATQKLKNDPRITAIGRILRKTSLDELPQLINVALGEMSLVGPRPMLPEQQSMYPGTAYYDLRPGITGPWQVSARNETTFAARAYFDTRYARSVSLLEDLRMLVSTIRVVVRATGY